MPWEVKKRGSKFVVVKKGSSTVLGTHNTSNEAAGQVRALYANTGSESKQGTGSQGKGKGATYGVGLGGTPPGHAKRAARKRAVKRMMSNPGVRKYGAMKKKAS